MTTLTPPPLQMPSEFALDKPKAEFFNTLLNTIYQMWNALYGIRTTAKILTTDNVVTSLARIDIPTDKTVMIEAMVVARRTGGTSGAVGDSAWYRLTGAYKNIAGTLTGIGVPELIGGENQASWNIGFSTSGFNAVVIVIGDNGNNITWEGTISTYYVGA
jgi:hypothetical protein